ncbi:MAG: hypothetical protein B6D61_12640 [Bacteroidetes bacterium 4484_249]|nr:MAG: hypothetical protein B6D61_12640 [Bacteroidetes bacterium 4484_249]
MIMKQILLSILITLNVVVISNADVVNSEIAGQVAKNHYWNFSDGITYEDIILNLSYTKSVNGLPVYYIFDISENKGFVIIAADNDVYPVLGYSFEGNFSDEKDNLPPNFSEWMDNYANQIVYVRENTLSADAMIFEKWIELTNYNPEPENMDNVSPLLTTNWDQGIYYNTMCPVDNAGPGGHVYVGCVATAMGQIMKYHNYPDQGSGTHTYYCYPYGTQTANFGETTYNWSSMPNQVYSSNTAVATLLYHCGVGVNMQYSATGSGAYSDDARDALVDYFTYSSDAQLLYKSSYSSTTWENMLKNDLEASRPLYYAGSGNGGGHAFVCDGYQGTNYFHFNWGWSGYANGYFYLTNLNPGGYSFNQDQQAIFYVYPDGTTTLSPPENLEAEIVNNNNVELAWDAPSGKDLIGYNIYRNNEIIDNTSETNYTDENLDQGTYEYYVTAVYDDGESIPSASVSVLIEGSSVTLFEDDFNVYTANQQLACQNSTDWTTWSNAPCGDEDPFITTVEAYSGANSFVVEGINDLVKLIDNYTTGLYKISFYMYVPTGFLGYFNTIQNFNGTNSEWGMQVFFNDDGTGSIDGGGQSAATFNFQNDTWLYNEVIVDLNNDWAEYILDGSSIHSWVWSIGAMGQGNLIQLGASNFYAWDGSTTKGTPKFYIDDYKLEELVANELLPPTNLAFSEVGNDILLTWEPPNGKDFLGYNVYYSDGTGFEIVEFVTDTEYLIETPGAGMHQYYITALYDDGESDPTNTIEFVITGTDESLISESKIYPNPASDLVNISSRFEIRTVKVFNYAGQMVTNEQVESKHYMINTSKYNPGIYFFRIETTEGITSKRIIIK